jgi:SAM-dependent methyltransferase
MDRTRSKQEELYDYPYHYLPEFADGAFRQHRYWSWGFRYLGRLEIAMGLLEGLPCNSLVDLGCGDGRFLREAAAQANCRRLLGIDRCAAAIEMARALNPHMEFVLGDVATQPPPDTFDVGCLLEVIEHVPATALPGFVAALAHWIRPGGHLLLTTPHRNVPLIDKHHQHFDSGMLRDALEPAFEILRVVPFDRISLPLTFGLKLLGGDGRHYIVTHPWPWRVLFRQYRKRCLYPKSERRCERIACLATRP